MLHAQALQPCPTLAALCTVAYQAPLREILQARILEWVAIFFSRGSSQPGNQTWLSALSAVSLLTELKGKHHLTTLRTIFNFSLGVSHD